jgi:FtsH-binding integral membrane protein
MTTNPVPASTNPMVANGVRAHIARVNINLAATFAITAIVAALAYPVAQHGVPQSPAIRGAIVAVLLAPCLLISRYIRLHNKSLIDSGAISTTRALLFGFAALIGLASDAGFAAPSYTSVAGIYAVAAIAFGTASLWGYGVKRELPRWVTAVIENLIVVEIVLLAGIAAAFAMETLWPHGIEYLKYAAGRRPTAPDDAGAEWVWSFFLVTYFALTLAFYARTIVRTYDPAWDRNIKSLPKGSLAALALLPGPIGALLPLLSPTVSVVGLSGYVPLARPSGEGAQRLVGVLAAFALYSSILPPLVIVLTFYLVAWGST